MTKKSITKLIMALIIAGLFMINNISCFSTFAHNVFGVKTAEDKKRDADRQQASDDMDFSMEMNCTSDVDWRAVRGRIVKDAAIEKIALSQAKEWAYQMSARQGLKWEPALSTFKPEQAVLFGDWVFNTSSKWPNKERFRTVYLIAKDNASTIMYPTFTLFNFADVNDKWTDRYEMRYNQSCGKYGVYPRVIQYFKQP